ncbi:mitochondrial presequence protease [Striga asiatica]|uniref:Mitochondrial presequence protease n=1 Tax=Striga asiatica TaxID=4170 RepID=A0A5A7PGV4_STRAF|nr:mitochondrial presequence protease [Striga asiatica]
MERENDEKAIERGESAIALSANFKPKSGITESQLAKFQRRLKIKAKSKTNEKDKGEMEKANPIRKYLNLVSARNPANQLGIMQNSGCFSRGREQVSQELNNEKTAKAVLGVFSNFSSHLCILHLFHSTQSNNDREK